MGGGGYLGFFPKNELVVHLKHLCNVYVYILRKNVAGDISSVSMAT